MDTPDGSQMPATGKAGTVKACQVFEVRDGRVTSTRHYFNLLTIMSQLGVAPGAEARAAH